MILNYKIYLFIFSLILFGCGQETYSVPPPPSSKSPKEIPKVKKISKSDITDFCDSIPHRAELASKDAQIIKTFRLHPDIAEIMLGGASEARIKIAFSNANNATNSFFGNSRSYVKPFEQVCRATLRERLFESDILIE